MVTKDNFQNIISSFKMDLKCKSWLFAHISMTVQLRILKWKYRNVAIVKSLLKINW